MLQSTNCWKTVNDNVAKPALISEIEYNALGELKTKNLGQTRSGALYTTNALQISDYTYNIRGWLRSLNGDYANNTGGATADRWFGMELSYDAGFDENQLNGNIAGTKWRTT